LVLADEGHYTTEIFDDIRYGQMSLALVAQALIHQLRHRLGQPFQRQRPINSPQILIGPRDTAHLSLTPALSHPMGEGARRAGEGTVSCILAIAQ
jgi:hypothetical protein